MGNVTDNRRKLYNAVSKDYSDIGSWEEFNRKMDNEANRRKLYATVRNGYSDIGSWDDFNARMYQAPAPQKASSQRTPTPQASAPRTAPHNVAASPQRTAPKPAPYKSMADLIEASDPASPRNWQNQQGAKRKEAGETVQKMLYGKNYIAPSYGFETPQDRSNREKAMREGYKRDEAVKTVATYQAQNTPAYQKMVALEARQKKGEKLSEEESNYLQEVRNAVDDYVNDAVSEAREDTRRTIQGNQYYKRKAAPAQKYYGEPVEVGIDPATGKKRYILPDGTVTTNEGAVALARNSALQTRIAERTKDEIEAIEEEIEALKARMDDRAAEVHEDWSRDLDDNDAPLAAILAADTYSTRQLTDKEKSALRVAIRQKEEQLSRLKKERDRAAGKSVGFWWDFGHEVGDIRTWDFGMGDFMDAMTMAGHEYYTSPNATEKEKEAGKKMMKAIYDNEQTQAQYADNDTFWNRAGSMTGNMLPFIVDFLLTGGGFEVVGVGSKAAGRAATRMFGEEVSKVAMKQILKDVSKEGVKQYVKKTGVRQLGKMAGSVAVKTFGTAADDMLIRAPLMTNTIQIGKTASDVVDRKLGGVEKDENGNISFTNDKTWGSSVWQAEANSIIENGSEMFGAHLDGVVPALAKTFGGKRISGMLARASASDFGRILSTTSRHFQSLGVSDYFGEVSEEYYGQLWRTALNLDDAYTEVPVLDANGERMYDEKGHLITKKENLLMNGQFHGDLWGGMGLSMGLMGAGKYGISGVRYGRLKRDVNKASKEALKVFTPDVWNPLRKVIDNTDNESMGTLAKSVITDRSLSKEQRDAAMNYMERTLYLRGNNLADVAKSRVDKDSEEGRRVGMDSALSMSYLTGYNRISDEDIPNIESLYNERRQQAESEFDPDFLMKLDEDPIEALAAMSSDENYTQSQINAALEYANTRELWKGMNQRLSDDQEDMEEAAGKPVGRAVMRYDGREVEVLSGRVVMTDDGTMVDKARSDKTVVIRDPATGKPEMVAPEAIGSYEEIIDGANGADMANPQAQSERESTRVEPQSKYTSGQIKIRNSDGTETRGKLTGYVDENGNHEYNIEGDLMHLHYASEQELDNILSEYLPDEPAADPSASASAQSERGMESVPEPVGMGVFGEIYDSFKGKAKDAVRWLFGKKSGEAKGVFHRDEVGDIGLIWGDDRGGLQHIIEKHVIEHSDYNSVGELTSAIEDVVSNGDFIIQKGGNLRFEKGGHRVIVAKNQEGDFVVTAYDNSRSLSEKKRTEADATLFRQRVLEEMNGTPVSSSSGSDGEVNASLGNRQADSMAGALPFGMHDSFRVDVSGSEESQQAIVIDREGESVILWSPSPIVEGSKKSSTMPGYVSELNRGDLELVVKRDAEGNPVDYVPGERDETDEAKETDMAGADGTAAELPAETASRFGEEDSRTVDLVSPSGLEDSRTGEAFSPAVETAGQSEGPTLKHQEEAAPVEANDTEGSALDRIPVDEKGKHDFGAVDADTAWDGLVEKYEGNTARAQGFSANMVKIKEAALKKAEKAKSKPTEDPDEWDAAERAREEAIESARRAVEHWRSVASVEQRRQGAIRAEQEAEARRLAAERAEAERAEREAREEAARREREALEGIPEWHLDTPENARKRGVRRFGGQMFTRQEPVQGVVGKEVEVKFSQSDLPKGHVAVIEASQLQPSHLQGQRNPMFFIEEAQPKNRAEGVSMNSAKEIAEGIRPQEITASATAYTGAPTVNARGEVIQGNNRSDALRYLWENRLPEQQQAYKQYLIDNAEQFGLDPEAVNTMQHPVLVNMLDVDDTEAIRLGQMTAQDTESGGVERIKPKNVAQKLGENMRMFASRLLKSSDEEASFGQLVDNNGTEVLKWMNQIGAISATQYQSAFDSKGILTPEAKNDLQKVLYQSVFKGGSQQLEEMFEALPAKAQKSLLSTAFRDMDSPAAGQMLPEIQASIVAYNQLMSDPVFANARKMEEVLRAIEAFKQTIALDDRLEQYMPSDNFSNFALHLAGLYKASDMSQKTLTSYFNQMYDLAQGKKEASLFEEADTTQHPLAEVIKQVLGIDYKPAKNGNNNVANGGADVALRNQDGQGGELRGNEPPPGREQNPTGTEPSERGGGTSGDSGRGGNIGHGGESETTTHEERLTKEAASGIIAEMEQRATVAPELELTIENWDAQFGEDGIVNTPIGDVKMGENQFTKLMRQGRNGKLGMIKPTLENPDIIIEDASEAKDANDTERESSYVFVKTFVKPDGSRFYYFTSVTVSKDGHEVVVSNQEKRRNVLTNLLIKGKLVWKHADNVSSASDVADGLYSPQGNMSDPVSEGTVAPQTNDSERKVKNSASDKQAEAAESFGDRGEYVAQAGKGAETPTLNKSADKTSSDQLGDKNIGSSKTSEWRKKYEEAILSYLEELQHEMPDFPIDELRQMAKIDMDNSEESYLYQEAEKHLNELMGGNGEILCDEYMDWSLTHQGKNSYPTLPMLIDEIDRLEGKQSVQGAVKAASAEVNTDPTEAQKKADSKLSGQKTDTRKLSSGIEPKDTDRSADAATYDAAKGLLESAGIPVVEVSGAEAQQMIGQNGKDVQLMGSRTDRKMAKIAEHYAGKELDENQRAAVDVFSGKRDNAAIEVERPDGKLRVVMQQGREPKAGAKHSLFRHFETSTDYINADDIAMIPEIIAKGIRSVKDGRVTYDYISEDGSRMRVTTEKRGRNELFTNYYSNKKPQQVKEGVTMTTQLSAPHSDVEVSDAKVDKKSEGNNEAVKFHIQTYHGSHADFTAFDFSHVGEGEGHQAFGWGGYVTEVENVGRVYARAAAKRPLLDGKHFDHSQEGREFPSRSIESVLMRCDGDVDKAIEWYEHLQHRWDSVPHEPGSKQPVSKEAAEWLIKNRDRISMEPRHLYKVDIPDDTGSNYFEWAVRADRVIDRLGISEAEYEKYDMATGEDVYNYLAEKLGSEKAASEYLAEHGYTGIKYAVDYFAGGNTEGKNNYVIFREGDMHISDHVRFLKTGNSEVYGWTVGGKVYLNRDAMNPETPLHEYTHLWDEMVQQENPELWARGKELMKQTPVWQEVIDDPNYSDIRDNEYAVASEVHSRLTGERGKKRIEEMMSEALSEGDHVEKAKKISLIQELKDWLSDMFKSLKRTLGKWSKQDLDNLTADDFADMTLRDLAEGMNPRKEMHRGEQMRTVTKANPMQDDYHTGIRSREDVKSYDEILKEAESAYKEFGSLTYPDMDIDMQRDAGRTGMITVYSSKPIEPGNFVTPSRMNAEDYSGGGKIYTKRVPVGDVAWISEDEGQYAPVKENRDGKARMMAKRSRRRLSVTGRSLFDWADSESESQRLGKIQSEDGIAAVEADEALDSYAQAYSDYLDNLEAMESQLEGGDEALRGELAERMEYEEGELAEQRDRLRDKLRDFYIRNNSPEDTANIVRDMVARIQAEVEIRHRKDLIIGDLLYSAAAKDEVAEKTDEATGADMADKASDSDKAEAGKGTVKTAGGTISYEAQGHLPDAKEGEFAYVERQFSRTGEFSFTGQDRIKDRGDVAYLFRSLEDYSVENVFAVLVKEGKGKVLHIGMGTTNMSVADMGAIRAGYDAFGADKIYLVHNHPSGNLRASEPDRRLMQTLETAFEGKVETEGIIIDTTSGRYLTFDGKRGSQEYDRRQTGESASEAEVYHFNKADRSGMPSTLTSVRGAEDVKSYLENLRFGDGTKTGYLILSHSNHIIGNFHTDYSDMADPGLAEEIASVASKYGGSSVIVYGNMGFSGIPALRSGINDKSLGSIRLLDVVGVRGGMRESAMDTGMLREDSAPYGTASTHEPMVSTRGRGEFESMRERAIAERGLVMPGLNDASVRIVEVPRHDFSGTGKEALKAAEKWAKENIVGMHQAMDSRGDSFEYSISNDAVKKYVSKSATGKSENIGVHLAALKKLPEIIGESVEAEVHPDYKKGKDEIRDAENGHNPSKLVHRFYGAISLDGKIFRVKTTIEEFSNKAFPNSAHSYEVTEIEAFIEEPTNTSNNGALTSTSSREGILGTAKLLQGVEKSYDPGKKLLEESRKADTMAESSPAKNGRTQDGLRYRDVEEVGRRFDAEIDKYVSGELEPGHRFELGIPSGYLRSAGFPDLPISMRSSLLARKAGDEKHPFEATDIKGLVAAIQKPIAVFTYSKPNMRNIIVDLKRGEKHFLVGVTLNYRAGDIEINSVSGMFPKESHEWVKWIQDGKVVRIDQKEKVQTIIDSLRTNPAESERIGLNLDEVAKIVNSFENPPIEEDKNSDIRFRETSPEAKGGHAEEMAQRLNTPIRVVRDVADLTNSDSRIQIQMRSSKGFYDPVSGEVVIVLPNHADVEDVAATVFHEVVGHKGLRELIGEENYDAFCDEVYTHLKDELKSEVDRETTRRFLQEPEKGYEHSRRVAVDELFGRMAEKGFEDFTKAERGVWAKLKAKVLEAINRFLGSLKLPKWVRLGDNELRYMLWRSHERLHAKGDLVGKARDAAKRDELGLNRTDVIQIRKEENIEEVNRHFNEQIDYWESGEMAGKDFIEAGRPMGVMRQFMPDGTITLRQKVLTKSRKKHGLTAEDIKGLPGALARPIFVFKSTPATISVLTELKSATGQNLFVAVEIGVNKQFGHRTLEVNDILTIHGREAENVILPIVDNNTLVWADKEKGLEWLSSAKSNSQAIAAQTLDDAAKIVKSFENPIIREENKSKEGVSQRVLSLMKSEHLTSLTDGATLSDGAKLPKFFEDTTNGGEEKVEYRFRNMDGETGDIWKDGSLGMEEKITSAVLRLSQKQSGDLALRNDAMRAIGGNLKSLRQAMSAQRRYDQSTAKRVSDLARILMQSGQMTDLTSGEVQRLVSAVKNAVGSKDAASVERVMDIMIGNQLRNGKSALQKLLSIRGSKVDARGVEVQGALDVDGQRMMEVVKKAMSLSEDEILKKIDDAMDRMGDPDRTIADDAAIRYGGLRFALDYVQNVKGSEAEEKSLRQELENAKQEKDAGRMRDDAYRQFVEATEDAIRKNKVERAEAYFNLVGRLSDTLRESVANARAFREAEKARVSEIHHYANSDMEGRELRGQRGITRLEKLNNNPFIRIPLGPLVNLDQMLRLFGEKNPDGRGYLYNHFMRGYIDSADKEQLLIEKYYNLLDKKAAEIFGERKLAISGRIISVPYKYLDIYEYAESLPKARISYYDGGGMREYDLSQSQLLYFYAVDKMALGKATNRRMGITDEVMEKIEESLDVKLKDYADWVQEELLPEFGAEMNAVHIKIFGADMDDIEHYFTFVRDKNALSRTVENGEPEKQNRISMTTGAIKKRKATVVIWDIPKCNFFDVTAHHIKENCHWMSFAELNRDFGTLLSYNHFKQQVMNMNTIYGSGKDLWETFCKCCAIATDSYEAKTTDMDQKILKIAKNIATSKIAFNPMPALKQLLSLPAFAGEVDMKYIAKDLATFGIPAVKWAWENMPNYRKRVKSRTMGDYYLSNTRADENRSWIDELQKQMSKGMYPNIGVDAWTIAVGSHGAYLTAKEKYLCQGYTEEKAERRAIQDAEICFNKSQQSSEGPFMAPVQIDRTVAGATMMLYRNSSTSYSRETVAATRNLKRIITGKVDVDFMTKQLLRSAEIPTYSERFDTELQQQIEGKLKEGHIYSLGKPGGILQSAGFPEAPIEMSSTRLAEKASQPNHPFPIQAVKGLVKALNQPIAVFRYGNNAMNVIIGLNYQGKQFLVGVHFNQEKGGAEVSSVRGLFPKDNAEWLNWISQGKATYINHKKIQAIIDQQRINLADVEYLDLEDVAKIINNFENPDIPEQKKMSEWREEDVKQARKHAKRELRSSIIRNFVNVNMFSWILPWLWRIGGVAPLLLLGGDDDREKAVEDANRYIPFSFMEGFGYGDVAADLIVTGIRKWQGDEDARLSNVGREHPLLGDISMIMRHMDSDAVEACNDIVNILASMVTGANPQMIANWTAAFMDKCGGDKAMSNEWALFVARLINTPQSQLDKIYFKEVGLTGSEAIKLTPDELAQRFAIYKVRRGYLFTPWEWNNEKLLQKRKNVAKKSLKEKLKGQSEERINERLEAYDAEYTQTGKRFKEIIQEPDSLRRAVGLANLYDSPEWKRYMLYDKYDKHNNKLHGKLDKMIKSWLSAPDAESAAREAEGVIEYKGKIVEMLDSWEDESRSGELRKEAIGLVRDWEKREREREVSQ